jgi:hypothetical protein
MKSLNPNLANKKKKVDDNYLYIKQEVKKESVD